MKKIVKTKWLEDFSFKNLNSTIVYRKNDLEEILKRLIESEATYCEIIDDEVEFYTETEETDEECEKRLKSEAEAKKTVDKFKFEQAKEIYLKYKSEFD